MLVKRSLLLVCVVISVSLSLVDGWKLRDLSQKNDENKVLPKKPIFRDLPMRKVVKFDSAKVNSEESSADGDDDEVATSNDDEGFTFEKVHTTNFDLPLKPIITLNNPDVERDEEERIEEAADTEKVASWLSHLPSLNIFSEKDENETPQQVENESNGFFGWLTGTHNKSTDNSSNDDDADGVNGFAYLKSLGSLTEFFISDDGSNVVSDVKRGDKSNDAISEKREPLTFQSFENLLLSVPSFVPNYTKINDIDCKRMGQIFQRQVRGQKLWALQSNNLHNLKCIMKNGFEFLFFLQ